MTVELVYGPVGSGKSYTQLARGLSKIRALRNNFVVANYDVIFTNKEISRGLRDRWIFLPDGELTPRRLIELSLSHGWFGHEGSCLLQIDEAGASFNSREWQSKDRLMWLKFLAQSRKFGFDVVFICQSPVQVDKQIRSSVEFLVKVINFRNFFWLRWLPIRLFGLVKFWTLGNFKGTMSLTFFSRSIACRYNTSAIFDSEIMQIIDSMQSGVDLSLD